MTILIKSPKKLIEVALPLDHLSDACAYEKMPGIGAHPRGIHHWWARRPLAAARSIIFSQYVNDPSWKWEMERPDELPPKHLRASWAASRKRLFELVTDLVKWENINCEELLLRAQKEINKSWRETCEINKEHPESAHLFDPDIVPGLHDPFAGGGAIPLEAQKLGLDTLASDLNPIATLINKAMIEIPPKFVDLKPVHPDTSDTLGIFEQSWVGTDGLVEDIRRYGNWIHEEAKRRIGHLYPKYHITNNTVEKQPDLMGLVDTRVPVIAWIWARTVLSPNPAFSHVAVPLVSSFLLSGKKGKKVWLKPKIDLDRYSFKIETGEPQPETRSGTKASSRGAEFRCILSGTPISSSYIREQGKAGKIGTKLLAVVAAGPRSRIYLPPTKEHELAAQVQDPDWTPNLEFREKALGFRIGNYGMTTWADLFTPRQSTALGAISSLVQEVSEHIRSAAVLNGFKDDGVGIERGGCGATAYAQAVSTYLAFALDRCAGFNNALCLWAPQNQKVMHLFGRQAIPMTWDFPEASILESTVGGYCVAANYVADCVASLGVTSNTRMGCALQLDAQIQENTDFRAVSTDPPYFDNIGYADLSDFFYVWLRRSVKDFYPSLFRTILTPKNEELVATPANGRSKEDDEEYFLQGMTRAMQLLKDQSHPAIPVTIYYAFKQSETRIDSGTSSSGWEAFLGALISAGYMITGTWPMRSEQTYRMRSFSSNALASSIVLVCRGRPVDAISISRRQFLRELQEVLPSALDEMTMGAGNGKSPVAPVDLSQAIIGPGMAVFSKYAAVLEADGAPMSVKSALRQINRFLAEDDFDAETQFCLRWFEQHGWDDGQFGEADVLARAKATSVEGIVDAGVLFSKGGKVRLRRWAEYPSGWQPTEEEYLPVWEALHQLVRSLKYDGEGGAGEILGVVQDKTEAIRLLAYRLYTLCERRNWAEDARAYNELVTSWSAIEASANTAPASPDARQGDLNLGGEQ